MTGLEFGKLPVHIRRIIYYSLSPYEQRALKKVLSFEIPNLCKRFINYFPRVAPAFVLTVAVPLWANKEYKRSQRKNPELYKDDK